MSEVLIESGLYRTEQVMRLLKISRATMRKWVIEGLAYSSRDTKAHYFRGRDVIAFMFEDMSEREKLLALIRKCGRAITPKGLRRSRPKIYKTEALAKAALQSLVNDRIGTWELGRFAFVMDATQ